MNRPNRPTAGQLQDRDRRAAKIVLQTPERYADYPALLSWAYKTLGLLPPTEPAANAPEATGTSGGQVQAGLDFGGEHEG
jgi:hypothetical protein